MKPICIILSFALLLAGCYSSTPITKDTPDPASTVKLNFRLVDGMRILSTEYSRVDNGYQIVGRKTDGRAWSDFSGLVRDQQIAEVAIVEFHPVKTIMAATLGAGIVVLLLLAKPVTLNVR